MGTPRKKKTKKPSKKITTVIDGTVTAVRPAYLFAERVNNLLQFVFGMSIVISAITASYLGFSSLSELLKVLIFSFWGRTIMLVIGFSYLIVAIWKLMHLSEDYKH